jgi:hypothetical protein
MDSGCHASHLMLFYPLASIVKYNSFILAINAAAGLKLSFIPYQISKKLMPAVSFQGCFIGATISKIILI